MQPNYTITRLKHNELTPAAYNRPTADGKHRSGFDDKSMAELANSIREHGILEPIVVRKRPDGRAGYEIVAGERRWTAAGLVNKKFEIPCIIRQLTDSQAHEVNTIENLQRVGLHPLEEAAGYQSLLDLDVTPPHTHETIAGRVGKSITYVYGRIKLLRAPELARKASLSGKLNHSNLLLIARITDPKQAHQCTVEILDPIAHREEAALDAAVEPMSHRQAKAHVRQKYMVRLKDAPFDPENADLVPPHWEVRNDQGTVKTVQAADPAAATGHDPKLTATRCHGGACSDCPFLTGNLKALYPDVESADVCTFTPCYKKKVEADYKRRAALAREDGDTLLKDKLSAALFQDGQLVSRDFVDLKQVFPGEKKKTWEDVLGDHVPDKLVQARDDRKKTHLLLPVAEALQAAKAAKVKLPKEAATTLRTDATPEDKHKEAEDRQRRVGIAHAVEQEALVELRKAVVKLKPDAEFWRGLAREAMQHAHNTLERHGVKSDKDLTTFLKKKSEAELRALFIEARFFEYNVNYQGEFQPHVLDRFKDFGVDIKTMLKRVQKAADASPADFKKALDTVSPETK